WRSNTASDRSTLRRRDDAQPDGLRELRLALVIGDEAPAPERLRAGYVQHIEGAGSKQGRSNTAQLHRQLERLSPEQIRDVKAPFFDVIVEVPQRRFPSAGRDVATEHGERDAIHKLGAAEERQGQPI